MMSSLLHLMKLRQEIIRPSSSHDCLSGKTPHHLSFGTKLDGTIAPLALSPNVFALPREEYLIRSCQPLLVRFLKQLREVR